MKFVGSIFIAFVILFASLKSSVAVETSHGKLEITKRPNSYYDTVKLNGKVIFGPAGEVVDYYKHFNIDNYLVVLLGTNCGGSGCPNNDFYFVIVEKGKKPLHITTNGFSGKIEQHDIEFKDNVISIVLGHKYKKLKYAEFKNKELNIVFREPIIKKLFDDDCRFVYSVIDRCMKLSKGVPSDCPDVSGNNYYDFGRGIMSSLMHFSEDHPGFNEDWFADYCNNSCSKQSKPDYSTFKKNVCNSN